MYNVLLIEHEEPRRSKYRDRLEECGCCVWEPSGRVPRDMPRRLEPDLIIVDLEDDGWLSSFEMRKLNRAFPASPVIAISSADHDDGADDDVDFDSMYFETEPVDEDTLARLAKAMLVRAPSS